MRVFPKLAVASHVADRLVACDNNSFCCRISAFDAEYLEVRLSAATARSMTLTDRVANSLPKTFASGQVDGGYLEVTLTPGTRAIPHTQPERASFVAPLRRTFPRRRTVCRNRRTTIQPPRQIAHSSRSRKPPASLVSLEPWPTRWLASSLPQSRAVFRVCDRKSTDRRGPKDVGTHGRPDRPRSQGGRMTRRNGIR